MSGIARRVTAAIVAASLVAVPTSAIAAKSTASATAPAVRTAPVSPWLTLSAMTSTSSSAASAVAAQDNGDGPGFPPIAPLVVILGTIALAIYILTKDDGDDDIGLPISP